MDPCMKIWFYTPGQLLARCAAILAMFAGILAMLFLY